MLLTNGLEVSISSNQFVVYEDDMPDNEDFNELREDLSLEWFLYWNEGKVYGFPRISRPRISFGTRVTLPSADYLRLIAARLVSVLPETLPEFEVYRRRPYTFRGGSNVVKQILTRMNNVPDLIRQFFIEPRYELDAKVVELVEENPFIGIFLNVKMRWEVRANLIDLTKAGIDLNGLYAILRTPELGQRSLVGRISKIEGDTVHLAESFDGSTEIDANLVRLEGSKATFARCLKVLLGNDYEEFEIIRDEEEAKYFTGPALDAILTKAEGFLKRKSPLDLGGVTCSIKGRIQALNTDDYQTVVSPSPVEYCFDPARSKRSDYAWPGIRKYGPYSSDTLSKRSPRILVLFPDTVEGKVGNFLRLFKDGIPNSRYPSGFGKTFNLINPVFVSVAIPWLGSRWRNHPAKAYREKVEEYLSEVEHSGLQPDIALVVLLDEHVNLPDAENPYLHTKSFLLTAGIPVQEVRFWTIRQSSENLQFIFQNLAIGLYAKIGGTPWTVDHDQNISDEIVIGMGSCELSGSRFEERQRHIGITTVFRGDGSYLLSNISRECSYQEYPEMLRETTVEILREIKKRNGWLPEETIRIVIHAFKPLKGVEVADITSRCVEELCGEQNTQFAFITVSDDHNFKLMDKAQRGIPDKRNPQLRKGEFAPERGTIVQIGRFTRLISTKNATLVKRANAPLPRPLLVNLHPKSTFRDQHYLAEQVLKFTSLSWRSILPASQPVSIYYSDLIAHLLARLKAVHDWSPIMLNIKLRSSRWFL